MTSHDMNRIIVEQSHSRGGGGGGGGIAVRCFDLEGLCL